MSYKSDKSALKRLNAYNMKQTAVDWFSEQVYNKFNEIQYGNISIRDFRLNMISIEEQAKQMEKEQMEELALYIYEYSVTCLEERINPDGKKKFEQYYNETYETNA
jgi:hypothetical protein